jgi:hypothetical protein
MWTLSGFADEIDPDPKTQFATLNDLGITHVEFRSAWGTNVLDLTDEQIDEVAALWRRTTCRSRPSAHRSARSTSRTTSTPTCCGPTARWSSRSASAPRSSGSSPSSCAPTRRRSSTATR